MIAIERVVRAVILNEATGKEVPEAAIKAQHFTYGYEFAEWATVCDQVIDELLEEGLIRSTLFDAWQPVKDLDCYKRFIPCITRSK